MLHTVVGCVLVVTIALISHFIRKHIEYARLNKLTSLIAWCVTEDSRVHRSVDLLQYIQKAQNHYVLDISLKLTSDEERDIAKKILKAFQTDTIQDFFKNPNYFEIPKSKYAINGERYFMFLLLFYLNEHKDKTEFIKHEMYNNDNTLTEFGIVFHKLLYISWMFFKNSDMTTKKLIWWPTIEAIPEQIRIS